MNRRDFMIATPLLIAGCGTEIDEMPREYEIQQSPILRNTKSVFTSGVSVDFTPTVTFGGDAVGITYEKQLGRFTLLNDICLCQFHVVLSAKGSSTGNLRVGGFPFRSLVASATDFSLSFGVIEFSALATNWVSLHIRSPDSSFSGLVLGTKTATTSNENADLLDTDCTDNTSIRGSISYLIDRQ